jgi:isopropylmalate/homocitrate/citramalate synthase
MNVKLRRSSQCSQVYVLVIQFGMYLQGVQTRYLCTKKPAYKAIKNALLCHKNGICTFMKCRHLTLSKKINLTWPP